MYMFNFLPLILFLASSQLLKSWPLGFYIGAVSSIIVFLIAVIKQSFRLHLILLTCIPYFTICALAIFFNIEPIYRFFDSFNAALFLACVLLAYLVIPLFPLSLQRLIIPLPYAGIPFIIGLLILIAIAFSLRNYTPVFYGVLIIALHFILKKFFPNPLRSAQS